MLHQTRRTSRTTKLLPIRAAPKPTAPVATRNIYVTGAARIRPVTPWAVPTGVFEERLVMMHPVPTTTKTQTHRTTTIVVLPIRPRVTLIPTASIAVGRVNCVTGAHTTMPVTNWGVCTAASRASIATTMRIVNGPCPNHSSYPIGNRGRITRNKLAGFRCVSLQSWPVGVCAS